METCYAKCACSHCVWRNHRLSCNKSDAGEAIIAYELPEYLQARAIELLEKNGEGELTDREHEEMMDFVRIDN